MKRRRDDKDGGGKAAKKQNSKTSCLEGWDAPRTPLEVQFMDQKVLYPDTLIAVECGYKYKFFGRDAEVAGELLGFYVNPNEKQGGTYCSCSFPVQRLEVNTKRLINNGYRVAHLGQAETTALRTDAGTSSSKLFARTITGIYTRATMVLTNEAEHTEEQHEADDNNMLLVVEAPIPVSERVDNERVTITVLCISLTTGGLIVWDKFNDGPLRRELTARLLHFDPAEVLTSDLSPPSLLCIESLGLNHGVTLQPPATKPGSVRYQHIPTSSWAPSAQTDYVASFYSPHPKHLAEVQSLPPQVQGCLGILISHLKQFNLHEFLFTRSVDGASFSRFSGAGCMSLPSTTLKNLEVFSVCGDQVRRSATSRVKGSLNWVMNHCKTGFGTRRLRKWLSKPLMDKEQIEGRHAAVEAMAQGVHSIDLETYKNKVLGSLPDLEKILTKLTYGKARPKEYLTFLKTVLQIVRAHQALNVNAYVQKLPTLLQALLSDADHEKIESLCKASLTTINNEAAAGNNRTDLFCTDNIAHPELAKLHDTISAQHQTLQEHLFTLRDTLRLPGLAYKTVSGIEFLVDVPQANSKLVPKTWVQESKVAKSIRYHTPTIKECVHKIQVAKDTMKQMSTTVFIETQKTFAKDHVRVLQGLLHNLSVLDALFSFAVLAKEEGWCKPEMVEGAQCLEVMDGRHPVIDRLLKELEKSYVPNDAHINAGQSEQVVIVTGPNMGGKSSYLRQVAVSVLLAQVGSYVPAKSARLSVFDGIYVRLGSHDSLLEGQSSFLVEISETSDILKAATDKSLLVLDELGRGTSTFDGIALAHSILEWIITNVGCFTLFVTHYPELVELENIFKNKIKTCHMSFTQGTDSADAQNVSFLYKLVPGVSPSSFGMNVARLAGIPSKVISTATARSEALRLSNEATRNSAQESLKSFFAVSKILGGIRSLGETPTPTPQDVERFKASVAYIDTGKLFA